MTKNANFVSHKKSKQIVDGKPKLPLASALVEGEIAINYAEDVETLSIKNESGTVVTFSSDNYYTEQKLGSGFTRANSAKTVTEVIDTLVGSGFTSSSITDVIIENEEIISAALTDLDDRKLDASAYTPTDLSNYYQKSETSGATEIATALSGKSDNGHTHVANNVTAMTGYEIATSASSISTTDTLIEAIGKLEKRIALLEAALIVQNNGDVYGSGGDYE